MEPLSLVSFGLLLEPVPYKKTRDGDPSQTVKSWSPHGWGTTSRPSTDYGTWSRAVCLTVFGQSSTHYGHSSAIYLHQKEHILNWPEWKIIKWKRSRTHWITLTDVIVNEETSSDESGFINFSWVCPKTSALKRWNLPKRWSAREPLIFAQVEYFGCFFNRKQSWILLQLYWQALDFVSEANIKLP